MIASKSVTFQRIVSSSCLSLCGVALQTSRLNHAMSSINRICQTALSGTTQCNNKASFQPILSLQCRNLPSQENNCQKLHMSHMSTIADSKSFVRVQNAILSALLPRLKDASSGGLLVKSSGFNVTQLRCFSDNGPAEPTEGEQKIIAKLRQSFPKAIDIQVLDISGGCGSMYEIFIISEEFQGKRTVAQHRMVTEALKSEIKDMHGVRINTEIPK